MNKFKLLIIILISFAFLNSVKAEQYQALLTGNEVGLRNGPGTNYNKIASLAINTTYLLESKDVFNSEKGCSAGWYKISYNGTPGFVCADYIEVKMISDETLSDCKTKLSSLGFPDSYLNGLCSLQAIHDSWSFIPLQTNLDWTESVNKESECGQSYVYTNEEIDIDRSCNNIYAGKVNDLYPASKTAVAYYMDPRNFFTEKGIFQFENLKYTTALREYFPPGIDYLLKNAQFYQYHVNLGNDFKNILNDAAAAANVNPVFLSSRILQELGRKDKEYNLFSGVYPGHEGYYNFINYGVSDSCAVTNGTSVCGLSYAQSRGWNSVYNALSGGASVLAENYIAQNQNTNYLQKFNVTPLNSSKLYIHQYMTNIGAPSSESISSFNTYNNMELLNSPFVFYIPVYNHMDENINNSNSGGSGEENSKLSNSAIATIITSSGFKTNGSYFTGVGPSTDAGTIINAIGAIGGKAVIKNQSGNKVTTGAIGTGFTVTVNNDENASTYTVVVNGDTNGDGLTSAVDLLQIQKVLLGTYNVNDSYWHAADTNDDGYITAVDLLQVQKVLLGTYTIGQ